jgi:hypothetical protein
MSGVSRPTGGLRWPVLAAIAAVAVIIIGIVVLVGGGDEDPAQDQARPQTREVIPPASQTTPREPRTPRGDIPVAVLNGTSVPNLARRVADRIEAAGFEVPGDLVTNAAEQNRSATVVMYVEGARDEARDVARTIDVGSDAIDVIDDSTRTLTQNRARVVVTVGADQSQQ